MLFTIAITWEIYVLKRFLNETIESSDKIVNVFFFQHLTIIFRNSQKECQRG